MKRIAISLFVLVISALASMAVAQDVVYLKNGSIIKGSVLEIVPEQSLKIQTSDGSIFVYQMNEVERIQRDANKQQETGGFSEDYLKRGFRGLVDLGIHAGFGDAEDNLLVMPSFTVGYQINRFFYIGAGCSPTLALYNNEYNDEIETGFILPIYGAIRFDFVNAKVSPFLDTRVGYSVTDDCRGLYTYIGAGCRIKKLSLSAGYTFQRKEYPGHDYSFGYDGDYFRYSYDDYLDFGFAGVRIGLEF